MQRTQVPLEEVSPEVSPALIWLMVSGLLELVIVLIWLVAATGCSTAPTQPTAGQVAWPKMPSEAAGNLIETPAIDYRRTN